MAGALDLVLTITAADAGSAVVDRFTRHLVKTRGASRELQDQLDAMNKSVTAGVKAFAVARFAAQNLRPGIAAAGALQLQMNQVERNIAGSVSNAIELAEVLGQVRRTATAIVPQTTLGAVDVVTIQNALLKAGLPVGDVIGSRGAAYAAAALSSMADVPAHLVGDSLAQVGNQFNLRGEQYSDAADWLARVDDATATSIPTLLQGLQMAGASAAAMNIPFEDTVTALGQLSPLGQRAGTSLDGFLRGLKSQSWAFGPDGFIGLPRAIEELEARLARIPSEQGKLLAVQKAFGDQGGRAALTFVSAKDSFADIEESARATLSLSEKLVISARAYDNAVTSAANAVRTTAAIGLEPMLAPLTGAAHRVRDTAVGAMEALQDNPSAATATSTLLGGGAAAAGAYGLYRILRGGAAGAKAWRMAGGVGGLAGVAAGVAGGKALEAATGVTPVFVTNWPGGLPGGLGSVLGGGAGGAAAGAGTRKVLKGLPATLRLLGGGWKVAGGVGAAGAAGYAVGTGFNWGLNKLISAVSEREMSLGTLIYDLIHGDNAGVEDAARGDLASRPSADVSGTIRVEFDDRGRLRVRGLEREGNADVDFSVTTGPFFYGMTSP